MLLAGLTPTELIATTDDDFDLEQGRLAVSGNPGRVINLADSVVALFAGEQMLWSTETDSRLDSDDLEARLQLAALDGGLLEPGRIDAGVLRHTYLAYLVRQGIRLSELERVVGPMPPKVLVSYGSLSPEGPGMPLEQIERVYPVFETDRH